MDDSTEHYLQLLRYWDDRKAPAGFDESVAEQRFLAFARDLEQTCGIPLNATVGASLQDANFLGQLFLRGWLIRTWADPTGAVQLRVSRWGSLATVSDQERIHPDAFARIKDALSRHGYDYIPPEVLEIPYSGRHFRPDEMQTWWNRYFDYE